MWYSDDAYFVSSSNPWVARGGISNYGASTGVFYFGINNGGASSSIGVRAALSVN